ncbi:ribosome-binding protein 1-like isoform X2 [Ptychodera flava]|uniref:ribosome-binding protein 1-like isoform X2 n=1 Tax=Ptychodera flava TaxID=63121 RepID=UPI003969DE43
MERIETTAMHPGMSVMEDKETTETTAVHHGMSVTEDMETTDTTAVHHGMSVTEDMETTEATAVHHGMSVTEGIETTDTTTVHHGMLVTNTETGEGTAMQPGSSDTGGVETTDIITKQSLVVRDKETTSKNSKQLSETFLKKESASKEQKQTKQLYDRKRKKMHESDKTRNPKVPRKEIRSRQHKQSNPGRTERNESGPMKTNQTKHKTQRMTEISTKPSNPPPSDLTTITESTDSEAFVVHVGLNEESYLQQMRDLDSQVQTISVREKKEQLKAAWEKIKAGLDKTESEAIANNTSLQRVDQNCRNSFGEGTVTKSTKRDSLAISLDLPTLYNLYRLKQTCLSGSFPDSFEPLLITDKMREEADKVGLQLKLKATYDQARFDELELFFINRDGGGLEPVKMYHDVIEGEDDEEILTDDEDTGQKSDTMVTGRVDSSSQTEQGQSTEDIQSESEMERGTLESQLKEAKEEKATLEERCKELTQKLESTQQSLVSQRIEKSREKEKLQSELEQNQKLTKELQDKVAALEHQLEQSDLKKQGKKGDWSLTLVSGQHQDQGQKFKSPRGLAFHRDKLVVCDSGNNIVQILNKDYTCDKVIGSFDGQFAKPFRPLSVAISRFNHYFILDDENKQIVVCDENGKIIQIITLPENIKVVWDIALMDDFVLVTLSLTSPDIFGREDRDERLVKYTQGGEHLKEVNGQISGQGQFYRPVSVVVNSNNVIMVYDTGNGCIKCFDSDLNFLHQFGQSQIPGGIVGYTGYIAVDEDDNVYVCNNYIDRILKYRCDGKWICYLLEGNVSNPEYIAVMGDKIGVVEWGSDQIKVFSK